MPSDGTLATQFSVAVLSSAWLAGSSVRVGWWRRLLAPALSINGFGRVQVRYPRSFQEVGTDFERDVQGAAERSNA